MSVSPVAVPEEGVTVTVNGMLATPPVTLMVTSKFSEISLPVYCGWVNSTLTTTHCCYYKTDAHIITY